jgi:hypothetical protein
MRAPVGSIGVLARSELLGKHLLQSPKHRDNGFGREPAKSFDKTLGVDRAKLIERNETRVVLKSARNPPRIGLAPGRHRSHDRCAEMLIQLVR